MLGGEGYLFDGFESSHSLCESVDVVGVVVLDVAIMTGGHGDGLLVKLLTPVCVYVVRGSVPARDVRIVAYHATPI